MILMLLLQGDIEISYSVIIYAKTSICLAVIMEPGQEELMNIIWSLKTLASLLRKYY